MYKISVPISVDCISDADLEKDLNAYLSHFKKGNAERVFIACLSPMYTKKCVKNIDSPKFKRAVEFFKENNIETGVWVGVFGHGCALSHDSGDSGNIRKYQTLTGVMGEGSVHGYCPLDECFAEDYMLNIKKIAKQNPDLIMLDDDFRLNGRGYYMGCFCPLHLKEFYNIIGEEIPREKIEELIFTGGPNKYRDAYMDLSGKTLTDFARKVRAAIDEINPNIRCGLCMCDSVWDVEGTDGIELAKILAGNTKPFLRSIGAPYHKKYTLIDAIEYERIQANRVKQSKEDIEVFSEGDVYPRPRYNVSSKSLELFDLALICDGKNDGILKYMFPYDNKLGYENGYIKKHINNLEMHKKIKAQFNNKETTGVTVFSAMHTLKESVLPKKLKEGAANGVIAMNTGLGADILSKNSIPTCYQKNEYPVLVCGENARHIPLDMLTNGAVLDSVSAQILKERGIDTGLVSCAESITARGEYYIEPNDTVNNCANAVINKIECDKKAVILSFVMPQKSVGAYTYENNDGTRFFVLAGDFASFGNGWYGELGDKDYFNNYYRQKQVASAIEWVGRKKLPAVCENNPNLYIMTAKNDMSMSVLMLNLFMDDIDDGIVKLNKNYSSISFAAGNGKLDGSIVRLSNIPPYGVAAFEVKNEERG